ncbi:MAG: HlyD family secretion protein [Urechidicola sp.]
MKIGLSDGVNIEILSGITADDELKIWNKADKGPESEVDVD